MKDSIINKLKIIKEQYHSIGKQLSDEATQKNNKLMVELSKELSRIEPVVKLFEEYSTLINEKENATDLIDEKDDELQALAKEEIELIDNQLLEIEEHIMPLLLTDDPIDNKEIIARVLGKGVFSKLKYESGTHRVQRIPKTESQGRIHTSACTVAIIPEVDEVDEIEINTNDLRVDTYRASGAGGQHVNKTDSAVRLTHIPTGTVAECQDNRSQHKNKAKAMSLLKARIYDMEQKKIADQQAEERKMMVGSGDRSERIRTYNFPQGRVTDHRIGLTLYNLAEVMEGDLMNLIESLAQENAAKQMSQLDE